MNYGFLSSNGDSPGTKRRRIVAQWKQVTNNPCFRKDLDQGFKFPGGPGLQYSVPINPLSKVNGYGISALLWCSKNCRGEFYRIFDPVEFKAWTAQHPGWEGEPINLWGHLSLSIMTFALNTDAVRFKLAGLDAADNTKH